MTEEIKIFHTPAENSMDKYRRECAARFVEAMLIHPKRYKPAPDQPSDWHEAIAQEAVEIADALIEKLKPELKSIDEALQDIASKSNAVFSGAMPVEVIGVDWDNPDSEATAYVVNGKSFTGLKRQEQPHSVNDFDTVEILRRDGTTEIKLAREVNWRSTSIKGYQRLIEWRMP